MNPEELAQRRRGRAGEMDGLLRDLFDEAIKGQLGIRHGGMGMALVAVGGYGRQELSPFSDLDVVLMHDSSVDPALADAVAQRVWYPLWDRKINLDNSVRDTQQMIDAAAQDYRVATGMLDARPVAGDFNLVLPVRSLVLAAWRRNAKSRLAEVRQARLERIERSGWLSHAAVPDLKESGGGLRDGVTMRSLVATWLVDIPHAESEYLRTSLLDVRDALHEVTGKRSDRFSPEVIPEVARFLGYGAEELDLHTRHLGWRSAHLNALAWRKVDDILAGPKPRTQRRSGPQLIPISAGVAKLEDEIVLTADADVKDPELALRAAVGAVEEGVALSTTSARRIAGTLALLPEPWPSSARRLMVDFLASGSALVPVWDELDYCGVVERWLPEWSAIRLRGSSSPVHRFTVDRHMLEACVEASKRLRDVSRPDVLVVAALLHDIGKGVEGDHSEVGAPMAEAIALRWGFEPADAATVGLLVRWHLLLPTIATRRDIEDPETAANVAAVVGDVDTLDMLAAITESDARATNAAAWSTWRAGLILGLVAKVRAVLEGAAHEQDPLAYEGWPAHVEMPDYESLGADGFILQVETHHAGSLIRVTLRDRIGAMADIAGAVALAGLEILSARTVTHGEIATTLWEVTREGVDAERVASRLRQVLSGDTDLASRLSFDASKDEVQARVRVLGDNSQTATLLEVRAHDRRGLVWSVARAIADQKCEIRSAHLSTYGPEARDVFYVVDAYGNRLDDEAASSLKEAVALGLR